MMYQELLEELKRLSPDQLVCDVTVQCLGEEFFPVKRIVFSDEDNGVFWDKQPILQTDMGDDIKFRVHINEPESDVP